MTAPDVNTTGYAIAFEASVGVLPGTPNDIAFVLEPNDVTKLGADVTGVRRDPISKDRMPRSSTVVDLDSGVEMEMDCTSEHMRILMGSVMMASGIGRERGVMYPTSVNTDEYVVSDVNVTIPAGRLIFASGFAQTANNGLKLVAGTPSDTQVPADNLVAETTTTSQNATVEICGVQGDTADFRLTSGGNLTSEVAGLDFTTLGWSVGQILHLGDPASGAAYRFATITDNQYAAGEGFVRIRSIAAHLVTLDKNEVLIANGADAGTGKTIRILYGEFLREWADDHANHSKRFSQIETSLPELDGGTDAYLTSKGNLPDTCTFEFPLTDIVKMSVKWVGTDTPAPSTTRETWDAVRDPVLVNPFNTTSSYRRKRLCTQAGVTVVSELKELSLTINNGVTPEKTQGRLGAFKMNLGNHNVEGTSTWLLDDPDILANIRSHSKLTMDLAMGGEDGGFYIDFPSLRISGGNPGLERNTSVSVEVSIMPEKDASLGYMMGFNRFPYLP